MVLSLAGENLFVFMNNHLTFVVITHNKTAHEQHPSPANRKYSSINR
jgi:hypothetical protein